MTFEWYIEEYVIENTMFVSLLIYQRKWLFEYEKLVAWESLGKTW